VGEIPMQAYLIWAIGNYCFKQDRLVAQVYLIYLKVCGGLSGSAGFGREHQRERVLKLWQGIGVLFEGKKFYMPRKNNYGKI